MSQSTQFSAKKDISHIESIQPTANALSHQSLLPVLQRLNSSMEALAAIGAELRLRQSGAPADPRLQTLLREAIQTIEPGLLDDLTREQEAVALASINAFFRYALDLIDDPGRPPGWSFRDPAILQNFGQMSRGVVRAIDEFAPQLPEFNKALRQPGAFLDVGTGVGWLAIEAARTWPMLRIVGIDPWEPSLNLARQNLVDTAMTNRIELRMQGLEEIPHRDEFTFVWLPSPFLPPKIILSALAKIYAALKPGGWLVFGLFASPPDPLGRALTAFKVVRSGGHPWNDDEVEARMRDAGFEQVKSFAPTPLLRFTVGKRPNLTLLGAS
jgi:SAM-dependent methyltransferase